MKINFWQILGIILIIVCGAFWWYRTTHAH